MSDRLAEIEARLVCDEAAEYLADLDCVVDRRWLIARIRTLEAQAAKDAEIIETMLEIYPDLANAATLDAMLAAREVRE